MAISAVAGQNTQGGFSSAMGGASSTGQLDFLQLLVKQLGLDDAINRHVPLLKLYMPY